MVFLGDFALGRASAATVNVYPSNNIQTLVNANASGTTFVITPGVYRMQSIVPKSGNIFLGQPGAILNGSRLLTSFARSGSYYVVGGQTQRGSAAGVCVAGYDGCQYPEDLFFNNVPLQRVTTLAAVTLGKWYFDYATAQIYFLDNPTGKTVEIGVTPYAFSGSATGITIKGLIIEKYATPAQYGAIADGRWTVQSNEIRLNHGAGIRVGSYQLVDSNYIHHNGQQGVLGNGTGIVIQNNEIAFNNTLGFDYNWEAGGVWLSNSTYLNVQGNYIHDNKGLGIHLDYQTYSWTIQGNRTSHNYLGGIDNEIGYDGTARYNIIENEGTYPGKPNPSMWWGCGIYVYASQNTQIYGNTVINSSNGICGVSIPRHTEGGNRGAFELRNLNVHENVIVQSTGSAAGAVASEVNAGYYEQVYLPTWNNRWTANTYKLSSLAGNFYTWQGGTSSVSMTKAQWEAFGQDIGGVWISPTDSNFPSKKFAANQRVRTLLSTQVWSIPTPFSALVTTEAGGALGTITDVAGPILRGGEWWWNVKFDDGRRGWCEEISLGL